MKYVRLKRSQLVVFILVLVILLAGTIALGTVAMQSAKDMRKAEEGWKSEIAKLEKELAEVQGNLVTAYVLNADLEAGSRVEEWHMAPVQMPADAVPANAEDPQTASGKILKIDAKKNSILTSDMLYMEGEIPDDLRLIEYTVINLPSKLKKRDVVDVRINLPNGEDYIVLSKKRVEDLEANRVWFLVNEQEILTMSSAVVDAYINDGILYAATYADPEMQKKASVTYPPNEHVLRLIKSDPNIVEVALSGLEREMRKALEKGLAETEHFIPKTSGRAPAMYEPVKTRVPDTQEAVQEPPAQDVPQPESGQSGQSGQSEQNTDILEEQQAILGS